MISKSSYLSGLRCRKLFWHEIHSPVSIPKPDAATQALFDEGTEVGTFARTLYPDGLEVAPDIQDPSRVAAATASAIRRRGPLFEPGFQHGDLFARADILVPAENDKWDLIEVKSSTEIKEYYLDDVAVQKYICERAGLNIGKAFLLLVNTEYTRQGPLDNREFFAQEEVTHAIKAQVGSVPAHVAMLHSVIAGERAPSTPIGPYCDDPHRCPLYPICWHEMPKDSILTLTRFKKEKAFELYAQGHTSPLQLPENVKLTDKQSIQIDALKRGTPHIDKPRIAEFLNRLNYPLYFLDFETFATALPKFDRVRPYQSVPFQFSLHVVTSTGAQPVHNSYLAPGPADPRPEFLRSLKNLLGGSGSIVAYNAAFEKTVLRHATEAFPEFADWYGQIEERFVDLLLPFREFSYYHPAQHGSTSIKHVLPVLTDQSYEGKPIADGGAASREYLRVTFGGVDVAEKERVRNDLKSYCHLDTLAMILLTDALRKLV